MWERVQSMYSIELLQRDIDYFKWGEYENPRFWARLGRKPPLKDMRVLDVGCGHGSLCIDIALSGAEKVVGLDIDSHRIEFANENLRRNYPQLTSIVEFRDMDLRDYPEFNFDAIVSKDTFEHIIDLESMISEMKKRLGAGGRIYVGIGPLYNSPFGDHGRTKTPIPWGHLLISETRTIKRLNRHREDKIGSIFDLGLNGMSLADYRKVFRESGLAIISFRVNQSAYLPLPYQIAAMFSSLIRKIPFLEEYFTFNIYCILEKVEE
jgi:cyclopropane fatty-acyl-phospholipid synthase-like methyltransferase